MAGGGRSFDRQISLSTKRPGFVLYQQGTRPPCDTTSTPTFVLNCMLSTHFANLKPGLLTAFLARRGRPNKMSPLYDFVCSSLPIVSLSYTFPLLPKILLLTTSSSCYCLSGRPLLEVTRNRLSSFPATVIGVYVNEQPAVYYSAQHYRKAC